MDTDLILSIALCALVLGLVTMGAHDLADHIGGTIGALLAGVTA